MKDEVARIVSRLEGLDVAGRMIPRLKSSNSCYVCRRKIEGSARLLWPGAPTCSEARCEMVLASEIGEVFSTPYGRAIDAWTLRVFCVCKDGSSTVVERSSLLSRAVDIATAFVDLTTWQWTYDSWMQVRHPEAWRLGKTIVIPPRRIEEVVRVRLHGPWERVDPTSVLPTEVATELNRVREGGPEAVQVPF